MPAYNDSPFNPTALLVQGFPGYSFGSYNNLQSDTILAITNTALTSNVATFTYLTKAGGSPTNPNGLVVGQLVSVQGSQQNAAYNVVNKPIVALPTANTFTLAVTHANITTGVDNAAGIAKVPEVAEALAVGPGKAFAVPFNQPGTSSKGITYTYSFPSAPASVSVQLEGAINDVNAEYSTLESSPGTTTTGETRHTLIDVAMRFVRINVTAASGGTSPTIVGKILI